jgi:hypothetical protein
MIVCNACFHAVPPGLTNCIVCGGDVDPEPEETAELEPRWVILRTFSAEYEARLVAGRLIAHGVPACVLSQVDSTRGFTVGALAVAKVFVPEAMVEEAHGILAMPGLDEGEEGSDEQDDGADEGEDVSNGEDPTR